MVEKRDGCQILFLKFNPFSAILFYTDIILGRKNSDWSEFGCKEEDWTFGEQSWQLVWFLLHLWGGGGLNRQVNRVRKKEQCPWHWSQNYHILYYLRKNMCAFFFWCCSKEMERIPLQTIWHNSANRINGVKVRGRLCNPFIFVLVSEFHGIRLLGMLVDVGSGRKASEDTCCLLFSYWGKDTLSNIY